MSIDLAYPIVAFAKNGMMYLARNANDLVICSRLGWISGFYNGLTVVDCSGSQILIKEARKVGTVGILWGLSFTYGQRIRVELIGEVYGKLSMELFREKVLGQLKKDKHFWNAGGNLESIFTRMKSANSHEEIINYMTEAYYSESR
ncbi:MAG: hypothetical protein JNN04_07900 [Cyclobacteriaceae bacterium]|nr:hypothetical protein [Cyclobacteriaceae bacterium]